MATERRQAPSSARGPWVGVIVAAFVGYVVHLLAHAPSSTSALHHLLFNLPFALASIGAWRAGHRAAAAASAWRALSASTGCYLAGNLYGCFLLGDGGLPSPADALWLTSYALAALALVLLARASITRVTAPVLVDGAIAGTVAAALATCVAVNPLLRLGRGGLSAASVTTLAYPVADLLLIALLATTFRLVARVDRVQAMLGAGVLLLLVGDCVFLLRTAHGSWVAGSPLELLWVGSATTIALAASLVRPTEPVAAATPRLAVPVVGGLVCVALLVWGQVARPGLVTMLLALAGTLLVALRVSLAIRDLRSRAERVELCPARLAQVAELRDAFADQRIVAHFQPQVDLRTDRVVGVEVLARWIHRTRGVVGPDEFLPLVVDGGLMSRLTETMLDHAASASEICARLGHRISLSVNLSTPELTDPALVGTVADVLRRAPSVLGALTLEITEETMISDSAGARTVLSALRALGVRLSLDDYGTGYASLAYLRDLPLDEVKLDRSFVDGALRDSRSAAIAASTVELAHHLDLSIVAEGIEDASTGDWLLSVGCDVGQGFHYARPMPLSDLVSWLDARRQSPAAAAETRS